MERLVQFGPFKRRLEAIGIDYTKSYILRTREKRFGSKDMLTECLEIWKDWVHLEMNIDDVVLQRKRLMLFGLNLTDNESPDEGQDHVSFITAVTSLTNTTIKQLLTPMD